MERNYREFCERNPSPERKAESGRIARKRRNSSLIVNHASRDRVQLESRGKNVTHVCRRFVVSCRARIGPEIRSNRTDFTPRVQGRITQKVGR